MKVGIVITVVLLIVLFAWAIWAGGDAKHSQGLVAASAVVAAAIFSALITQQQVRQRELTESHRMRKIVVYEEFGDVYLNTLKLARVAKDEKKLAKGQADVVDLMFQFSKRAMLWASPEVLIAYNSYREYGQNNKPDKELLLKVDDVLRAMRRDLGLSSSGLERGSFVSMFLTDPNELKSKTS